MSVFFMKKKTLCNKINCEVFKYNAIIEQAMKIGDKKNEKKVENYHYKVIIV